MMRQLAWYASTYCPHVVTTCQQSKQHHTNRGRNLTVTFRQELDWLGYGWAFRFVKLPNPLKICVTLQATHEAG